MAFTLRVGDPFPDIELPNQQEEPTRLSQLTRPGQLDQQLGFHDGYPLILAFYRGFFCPRDQQQMRLLVQFQSELAVNFGRLAVVSADPPLVQAAFRAGLGAQWTFLADPERQVIRQLGILDETEGEYAYRARPFTFVLRPDLTIHRIYDGWYFVGRPTLDELRQDLRAVMETLSYYPHAAWDTEAVRRIRIPQQEWAEGAPKLGASGLPVLKGEVRWFDLASGNGGIAAEGFEREIFFNFTAIPGQGYRTIRAGTSVSFELVENPGGPTARNIQTNRS
jgi:peroxiredoxin/cold shock CspA family protein